MTNTENSLGVRITELRNKKGLTKQQLAGRVGISPSYLAKIEKDESDPTSTIVAKLALFLGSDIEYLILGENKDSQLPEDEVDNELAEMLHGDQTDEKTHLGPPKGLNIFDYEAKKQILHLLKFLEKERELKQQRELKKKQDPVA